MYHTILSKQKAFSASGKTRSLAFRRQALETLRQGLLRHEKALLQALHDDLGKCDTEAYMTELGMLLGEIRYDKKHLEKWARPRRCAAELPLLPARCAEYPEPFGSVLILAPWNYPLLLCLQPLVGAIAAGNCAVLKPSELAPATSHAIAALIADCFGPEYVAVVEGDAAASTGLLEQPFDFIFFTGGERVGKIVMQAAARQLIPVCLELGGKSPCIVDQTADLALAARRIAHGKLTNAGQTCVAPDYLLVHRSVKDQLVQQLIASFRAFAGEAPLSNPDYPCIINDAHAQRLEGLLERGHILCGGRRQGRRIEPTLLDDLTWEDPIMQQEIFGPLLPILVYDRLEDAMEQIAARPKPLALYIFTRDKATQRRVLGQLSFGGGCVNDTLLHVASHKMGFGGVGASGMGRYHGQASFVLFSHYKSVLHQSTLVDMPVRYPPYSESKLSILRRIMR